MISPITTKGTYDNWCSVSASSAKRSCSPSNQTVSTAYSGSRMDRCFQSKMPPSEQLITENFYCGTRNFTPGPASYKGIE